MNSEPPPLPPEKPLVPAVILAFLPTMIVLVLFAIQPSRDHMVPACVIATILSLVACFLSSFLLIRRNTSSAVVFGILLGLLNLLISAGLGCAALLSDNAH